MSVCTGTNCVGASPAIVDTGTAITSVTGAAYRALNQARHLCRTDADCLVDFQLGSSSPICLRAAGLMTCSSNGICIIDRSMLTQDTMTTIGYTATQSVYVEFDRTANRIGFAERSGQSCSVPCSAFLTQFSCRAGGCTWSGSRCNGGQGAGSTSRGSKISPGNAASTGLQVCGLTSSPTAVPTSTAPTAPTAAPTTPPTVSPTAPTAFPTEAPTTAPSFVVSNADMTLTGTPGGVCMLNASCFGTNGTLYGNNERCTFVITNELGLVLNARRFQTEGSGDNLTINGHTYSGSSGPENVTVAQNVTIQWSSDESSTHSGFTVCFVAAPSASPTAVPTSAPSVPSEFFRQTTDTPAGSWEFSADGRCIENTGSGNQEHCSWTLTQPTMLVLDQFHGLGTLRIGSCEFTDMDFNSPLDYYPNEYQDGDYLDNLCDSRYRMWSSETNISWSAQSPETTGFGLCIQAPTSSPTPQSSGSSGPSSTLIIEISVAVVLVIGLVLFVWRSQKKKAQRKNASI